MSKSNLFQQLFTTNGNVRKIESVIGGLEVLIKSNIEKAQTAAVLAMKKGHLQMTEGKGYLVSILTTNGAETVGYGVTKDPVDAAWCTKHSGKYLLQLTPKEVTSMALRNKATAEA